MSKREKARVTQFREHARAVHLAAFGSLLIFCFTPSIITPFSLIRTTKFQRFKEQSRASIREREKNNSEFSAFQAWQMVHKTNENIESRNADSDKRKNGTQAIMKDLKSNFRASASCSGNAVDPEGKACVDLQIALEESMIYIANTTEVSYMVCAIPKNGCSYHLALLHRINGEEFYETPSIIHNRERKAKIALEALPSADIAREFMSTTFSKYVVVRNPLLRTLSAFLDKVLPYMPKHVNDVDVFQSWVYHEFPLRRETNFTWMLTNPHWRPQSQFCGFGYSDFRSQFRVFHTERPSRYLDFLESIIPTKYLQYGWSRKRNLSFREYALGPRRRTRNTGEEFRRYFSNLKVFDHLAFVLRDDIDLFGYRKEIRKMRNGLET